YEDRKGYEDTWRKHHVSPVTRDVWLWHRRDGRHERVTTFGGEDRNPAFSPDGKGLYYLSEAEGTSNVRRWTRDGTARVTAHETHPVRYLTVAADGTVCYGWDGGVYVVKDEPSARPRRVEIRVAADDRVNDVVRLTRRKDATEIAVSPKGDEIAFVVRGDVFVASTEHGTTRRVTATPEQERSISWGPDGTWMVYGAERACSGSDGPSWNLFRASLARAEEDERFFRATLITEEPLFACPADSLQPVVSPDGTKVAFLRDRDELCVLDVATRAVTSVLPAEANYSYLDGDIRYEWSPDSKWLAVNYLPNRSWIAQVGVIEVATGKVVDVTASGYEVNLPKWSRDGRALLFLSEQHGRRSHSASGAEVDAIAFLLNRAAFDRAVLSEEEYERLEEREAAEKKKRRGEGKGSGEGADDKGEAEAEVPPPVVEIDFAYPERRRRRVTLQSAPIADYVLSPDGETCLYLAEVDGKWDVWGVRPRSGETRRAVRLSDAAGGALSLSKDGKTLFVLRDGGRISKADVSGLFERKRKRGGGDGPEGGDRGPQVEAKDVAFAAEMAVDTAAERAHLFEHMWRQVQKKFYRADLHGRDWRMLHDAYARFLPQVADDHDFAELASELLGELNASHTGCRWRPLDEDHQGAETAALGLLFDLRHTGDGLPVVEVLRGGPCDRADATVRVGEILTAIDGRPLDASADPWPLLDHRDGQRVRLSLRDPTSGATREQVVRAIDAAEEARLLYERLLDRRRAIVERASEGRIGYVHVAGMNDRSFRRLFEEALGRNANKEALIVDTRFNGGGWLHDQLVVFLSGKRYADFVPRGKEPGRFGGEPFQRWDRPSCVLVSEGNYSDAHFFPYAYQSLGLGKVVGAPLAGTATAVWWERLINPALVFGIPQVGMVGEDGAYLENRTLEPDVVVLQDPVKVAQGEDEQLLAAVRVLLGTIGAK
ncbi:MAG TPA: S41 family peptidase, partial [Planctomycetota bacterium]|nr:S41 family peptidase [Planctomycetota bacterium]